MIFRFCLYGFLKNQKYYEPFLILAFLEKGLSFFVIGLLVGFREVCVNLFELPSGAAADLYGRRRSMMLSFTAYIIAFLVFAYSRVLASLFLAMGLMAVGDAFRSGTHKAMIFDWLKIHGRPGDKAEVYGTTRSWSQIGSAVSVLIAALVVIVEGSYSRVFLYSTIPYALGLINFFGYPIALDGKREGEISIRRIARHLWQALGQSIRLPSLRRLLGESMLQRGTYTSAKDYLQPVLQHAALLLPFFLALDNKARSAILVGVVYCGLYLLSAVASRQAHHAKQKIGEPITRGLWWFTLGLYALLIPALGLSWSLVAILIFVALAMLQNLWKPLFLERVDQVTDDALGATLLSIDSQAKAVFVMFVAPLLGWSVDQWGLGTVGVLGLVTATLALLALKTQGGERLV